MIKDRFFWGAVGVGGVALALSLALYLFQPFVATRVLLQFPDEISKHLTGEVRSLPFEWNSEKNAELLLKECLLGPLRHDHLRLVSSEAKINSILLRNGTLFVDLTKDTFLPEDDVIYSPVLALGVLKATLMDNIPAVRKVSFSIDGEPVR